MIFNNKILIFKIKFCFYEMIETLYTLRYEIERDIIRDYERHTRNEREKHS